MAAPTKDDTSIRSRFSIPIPIFYKLMVSMLFIAVLPIALLGMVSIGGTESIITVFGLSNTIFIITLITLTIIMMWSFFLASHITEPIITLSKVATSMSMGDLKNTDIKIMSNDEIGELVTAFNKMVNTYRIIDSLAKEERD